MPGQKDIVFTWRKLASSLIFAIVFLAIGWSVFWYIAHRLALRELDAALAAEARVGRVWSCKTITPGGYPLSIDIGCDGFSVIADSDGRRIVAQARAASVHAPLHSPKRIVINVDSPANIEVGGLLPRVDLEWRTLQFSTRGLPDRLERLSAAGSDVSIRLGDQPPTAASLFQSNIRRAGGTAVGVYNYEFSIGGIRSRFLDATMGGEQLALVASVGSVTQIERGAKGPLRDRIESWRNAGGRVILNQLTLLKGDFAIQAEGALGLDQAHRIDGKLDLRIQNAGDRIAGIARNLGAAGPLAGALLGGMLPIDRQTGELRLPASFENGRLGVGPFKGLLPLPPLY